MNTRSMNDQSMDIPLIDLTQESSTPSTKRLQKNLFIDLTVTPPPVAVTPTSPTATGSSSDGLEVLYEARRLPVPPTRRGKGVKRLSTVDLTTSANEGDDGDGDLPPVTVPEMKRKKTVEKEKTEPESNCPVCLDTITQLKKRQADIMVTRCGHVFCRSCIDECLKMAKCCPKCRKPLKGKNATTKIFL